MGPSSRLLVLLALLCRAAAVALKKSEALPMVPEHLEERANASTEATVHAEAVQLEAEMRDWLAYDHHARIRLRRSRLLQPARSSATRRLRATAEDDLRNHTAYATTLATATTSAKPTTTSGCS